LPLISSCHVISGSSSLLSLRNHPPRQVVNSYTHVSSYETRPLTQRYLEILHELYLLSPVADWINRMATTTNDVDFQWLHSQLDRSQLHSTAKSKADLLASALHGTTVVVSAAGALEINGLYSFHKVLNGAGVYRKTPRGEGEMMDVWIYRCRMQNNSLRWFISIAPENRDPGTEADTDFYYSTAGTGESSTEQDTLPPPVRWKSIDRKYDPVPCLVITSSTTSDLRSSTLSSHRGGVPTYDDGRSDEEEDDSDHEDSMAVIDDEFAYLNSSTPGTPIDLPPSP
jgi:hypothetical protein